MKVVSGAQTGVDRAALDAAIALALPYGGWVPKGGWAEDSPDPPGVLSAYPLLVATPSADPRQRTEWNVRDSDRTLILVGAGGLDASRGSALTKSLAEQHGRPVLVVEVAAADAASAIAAWLAGAGPDLVLNVAGPRESETPGIYDAAKQLLTAILAA